MTVQSKADKFYAAIVSMEMSEYLEMIEYLGFGCANSDRTGIEEGVSIWDMALSLVNMQYEVEDLKDEKYKFNFRTVD